MSPPQPMRRRAESADASDVPPQPPPRRSLSAAPREAPLAAPPDPPPRSSRAAAAVPPEPPPRRRSQDAAAAASTSNNGQFSPDSPGSPPAPPPRLSRCGAAGATPTTQGETAPTTCSAGGAACGGGLASASSPPCRISSTGGAGSPRSPATPAAHTDVTRGAHGGSGTSVDGTRVARLVRSASLPAMSGSSERIRRPLRRCATSADDLALNQAVAADAASTLSPAGQALLASLTPSRGGVTPAKHPPSDARRLGSVPACSCQQHSSSARAGPHSPTAETTPGPSRARLSSVREPTSPCANMEETVGASTSATTAATARLSGGSAVASPSPAPIELPSSAASPSAASPEPAPPPSLSPPSTGGLPDGATTVDETRERPAAGMGDSPAAVEPERSAPEPVSCGTGASNAVASGSGDAATAIARPTPKQQRPSLLRRLLGCGCGAANATTWDESTPPATAEAVEKPDGRV